MSEDTYKLNVICENCDFKGEAVIQKGKLVSESKCPVCGNLTLRKALPGEVS
jgi:hypothetical protein